MKRDAGWKTYEILINGKWERVPGVPFDLDDKIALARVDIRPFKDNGKSVRQWRARA